MYAVADLMTPGVATIEAGEPLAAADALWLEHRVRHLPVLEGGRLVGLLTPSDALRARHPAPDGRRPILVRDAMSSPVHHVRPRTPLRHAAELMLRRQIGCLAVLDDVGSLAGLLTEAELVRFALEFVTEMDRMSEGLRLDARMDEAAAG